MCRAGDSRIGPDGKVWYIQERILDPYGNLACWFILHETDNPEDTETEVVSDKIIKTWKRVTHDL